MNKKIFSMLCMMTALGTVNVNAEAYQAAPSAASSAAYQSSRPAASQSNHSLSGVSLTVGVGMGFAHQTGFENSTAAIPDVVTYPVTKEKPTENTFAKFSPSYKQALTAKTTSDTNLTLAGAYINIPDCFITDSKDANPYLPTPLPGVVYIDVAQDKITADSQSQLITGAAYKKVETITPYIDYSQINSLNGSIGVDVKGGFGYKFYVNDGFYLHPAVNFAYYNAKSENAVDSVYQESTFYTRAVKAKYAVAQTDAIKAGAAVPTSQPPAAVTDEAGTQTLYSIDPETSVTQGVGSSLKEALTFQNQWYWNFVNSFGYQLSEGVSVEATVGYQMTRCKLTIKESEGSFANLGATFDKGSPNSTILNAIGLNDAKQYYSFGEELTEAEDSSAKMISGLVLGFGMNFAIAKNLTMGVSVTNVFNMAREFEIDDVKIAPTANSTAKAAAGTAAAGTAAAGTTGAGTTAAAGTTGAQSAAPSDPATTSFNAKMSQNQTGISVNLTYFIPMGSDCNPAA